MKSVSLSIEWMVFGRWVIPMKPHKKKMLKFVPKPKVWKWNDEETSRLFTCEMTARNSKTDDVQKK